MDKHSYNISNYKKNLPIASSNSGNMSLRSDNQDDTLYKQYKNNMLNIIDSRSVTQRDQIKKNENESNNSEMMIPVKVKSSDSDDWVRELKISMIVTFPTPSKQNLSINITDPTDPLFLYTLDIGEQEFHFLKQELSLLIEFQHFPIKFFEMLELCVLNKDNNLNESNMLNKSFAQSNYIAILHHNLTEALFIIQEITQFRQLNHLILRLKPSNDQTLKKYLAGLVKEFKLKSEILFKENSKLNENLDLAHKDLKAFKDELNNIKISHSSDIDLIKLEYQKEINDMKEKIFDDFNSKLSNKDSEKQNIVNDYDNKLQEALKKIDNLSKEKLILEDLKIKLEASERDLIGKNTIILSELKVYKEEVENLRNSNSSNNQNFLNQEKNLTEFRIKNEMNEKQIVEKEKNISNLTQLVDNLNKQKNDIEDSYKSIKATNIKLDDKLQVSIAEINKGNEIIQKLQNDIKSQKEKVKLNQVAMRAQEQLIDQKQNSIDELTRTVNDLNRESEKKDNELRTNKSLIDNYKFKIEEAEKICEDNAKVIRFLNQKLNDSYQPFRNIMKNDGTNTNLNKNNLPLSSLKNFKDESCDDKKNESFNKQPYFNSMAFQSQGTFNNNTNGFIMPETNFGNYKDIISGAADFKSSTLNSVNTNFETTKFNNKFSSLNPINNNCNPPLYNKNMLIHKYGTSIKNQDYNIQSSSDRNLYLNSNFSNENEDEEIPRQVPISNKDKFQHKFSK